MSNDDESGCGWLYQNPKLLENTSKNAKNNNLLKTTRKLKSSYKLSGDPVFKFNGNGNGLLFHMTQPISRSTIKAIACSKPTISEH